MRPSPQPPTLAFVHTAEQHVARFDALLARQAPGLQARHWVDAALLAQAQALGPDHPAVVARTQALVRAAAQAGAQVVVCTCSTVGAAAEATPTDGRWLAQRLDRAMADLAVQQGPRVLLVAALASTVAPTAQLLASSAQHLQRPLQVQPLLVAEAWPLWQAGDATGYRACVGQALRQALAKPGPLTADAVVLAQASMAELAPSLADLGVPVFSSPDTGLASALQALARLGGTAGRARTERAER